MPIQSAQKTLQNPGDTLAVLLPNPNVDQPVDLTAVLSLLGTFSFAYVAIEGLPFGQPAGTIPIPIALVSVINGQLASSSPLASNPVGPLTSSGAPGSGFAFTVSCGIYSLLQMRLVSINSGAIQAAIATHH